MDVRRVNDRGLEHLVAVLRYASLAQLLGATQGLVIAALALDWRFLLAGLILLAFGAIEAWLGWWHFGNASWRRSESGKRQLPGELPGSSRKD